MDKKDLIFRLQIMTLFDSTSYGLLYCYISPYLVHIGGDQVTIGIFTVATLIFQLMSIHIVRDLVNFQGQKAALYTIFNVAAISHIMLFVTTSTCFIIMARCVFSSINQSTNIIKNCLIKNLPPDRRNYHMNINTIMNSTGYIVGPMAAGALYDINFAISCCLASFLTIINIYILTTLPGIDNYYSESSDVPAVKRVRQSVERRINELKQSNFKHNWDILLIQYLFSTSVITFATKYAPVLKHSFDSDNTEVGWITSYMNVLIYIAMFLSSYLREMMEDLPTTSVLNCMFSILFISSILALYSPILAMYCIMCIPVSVSRIIITDMWEQFVSERQNPTLARASDSINILSGVTIPIIFGYVANEIDYQATIIFAICPLIIILFIINQFTSTQRSAEEHFEVHNCPKCPTKQD